MKQVLQDRSGSTVVRDVAPPPCPPGFVLVRNSYSVISSGTERARVELSQKSLVGKARERPDLVREVVARARREGVRATRDAVRRRLEEETPVGYSSAGTVIELGEAVRGLRVGDRVACGGGGYASHAEVVSVPLNLCARVPPSVALESAAMTTIGAIALHGVRLAATRVGDRVGVVGCGLVGQIACRLLAAAGAEVTALDVDPAKVMRALTGGAHHAFVADSHAGAAVLASTDGVGLDQVLITAASATNDPLLLACAIARDRGAVVLVGDVPVQAPRSAFYDKELSFVVSRSYGPGRYDREYEERGLDYPIGYIRWTEQRNMEAVLALQARRALRLDDLIEAVIDVDEAPRAYERLTGAAGSRPQGALVLTYPPRDSDLALEQPRLVASTHEKPRVALSATPRVGLIGPGSFASRVLVPALVARGAELAVVGGGAGPSAEAARRKHGFARIGDSAEAVAVDEEVDAVVIATRHVNHASLTALALGAGKHVHCEKPLALSTDELDLVLREAAEAPGILSVGFNRRFSPSLLRMKEHVLQSPHARVVVACRVSAGALPADHWLHDLSEGGGRVIGEMCHFVDTVAFLAGAPISVVYAAAYGASAASVQAQDNVVVTLSFDSGSVGTIVYVSDGSPRLPKERIEAFSGTRSAVLDDFRSLDLHGERTERVSSRTQDKGHRLEIDAFLQGVASGTPPIPLAEIANVSLATLAIVESLRSGTPVRVESAATPQR